MPAALGQSAGLVGAAALIFAADRYWAATDRAGCRQPTDIHA